MNMEISRHWTKEMTLIIWIIVLNLSVSVGQYVPKNQQTVQTPEKTKLLLGEILCQNDMPKLEEYMHAVLTHMNLHDKVNLTVMTLRIGRHRDVNHKQAVKFMSQISDFLDNDGAALVGCWVRDTEIMLPTGFPYIITADFLPDYIERRMNRLYTERRWIKQNVTTLTPPVNALSRPLIDLMLRINSETVVITSGAEGQLHFGDGLKDSYQETAKMDIHYERILQWDPDDILPTLVRTRARGIPNIVIHCTDLKTINNVLQEAMNLNMVTHDYVWYLTYADTEGLLQTYPDTRAELLRASHFHGPQLIDRSVFSRYNLTTDNHRILQQATVLDAATIIAMAMEVPGVLPPVFTSKMLADYLMVEFLAVDFHGALGSYGNLTLLPSPGPGRFVNRVTLNVTWAGFKHGEYKETMGVSTTDIFEFNSYFSNETRMDSRIHFHGTHPIEKNRSMMPYFNDRELTVVAKIEPPLVIFNETEPIYNKRYSGVMIDLLNHYAKDLGFRYNLIPANRMEHPPRRRRDTKQLEWTVMDYLRTGKADMAIGGFSANLERLEWATFTDTTLPCAWSLLMKAPKIKYSIFQFFTPFKASMWVSIFVTFLVVSVMLAVMDILDWTDANFPVRDSFYYVAGVLLSGTTDTNPTSFPSRMLVGCFIFFAIVTFQSYTANMAAFLTTRDHFKNYPKTLYDAATRTNMRVLLVNGSEVGTMIRRAKKDPYNQILTKAEIVNSYEEAMERLDGGESVLVSDTSFTEYYTAQNCDLMDREQHADMIRYAMAVPQGAKYLKAINKAIDRVKKAEIDRKTIQKWYTQPECQLKRLSPDRKQTKSLTMGEMLGIFLALGVGFVISFITAVAGEILVRHVWKKPGTRFLAGTREYLAKIPVRFRKIFRVYRYAATEHRRSNRHKPTDGLKSNSS